MSTSAELAGRVAGIAGTRGLAVGAAESLTGGALSSALAAAPDASRWYRGTVVAYSPQVKQAVLEVTPGPVVTRRCAEEMARGAARVLAVDAAVATTGVGGPDPEEGEPPGTVWVGVFTSEGVSSHLLHLDGSPADVVEQATTRALELLLASLEALEPPPGDGP